MIPIKPLKKLLNEKEEELMLTKIMLMNKMLSK